MKEKSLWMNGVSIDINDFCEQVSYWQAWSFIAKLQVQFSMKLPENDMKRVIYITCSNGEKITNWFIWDMQHYSDYSLH